MKVAGTIHGQLTSDGRHGTPLLYARGHSISWKHYLQGADKSGTDGHGFTPLIRAARRGHVEI